MLCLDLDTLVIVWVCFIVFCPQVSLLFASHNAPLSWEWHLINSILMSQWETDSRVWYWQTRAVWWSRSSHGAHVPASVCHQYMHSCSELVGAKKAKDNYILLFIFEVFMKSSISIIIAHSSLNKFSTSQSHQTGRKHLETSSKKSGSCYCSWKDFSPKYTADHMRVVFCVCVCVDKQHTRTSNPMRREETHIYTTGATFARDCIRDNDQTIYNPTTKLNPKQQ